MTTKDARILFKRFSLEPFFLQMTLNILLLPKLRDNHYLQDLNSLIFFILETAVSFIPGMIASLIFKPKYKSNINRALIKLDISSLEHNLDVLNQIKNKECVIMAAVKADA